MILKALYDYYHRSSDLPLMGTELKEIGYLIVIDKDGNFLHLESRMIDNQVATRYLVSQTIPRSGKKFVANFLWDNCDYVIGYSSTKMDKAELCKDAFVQRVKELKEHLPHNLTVDAIHAFYNKYPNIQQVVERDVLWQEMVNHKKNISFLLQGNTTIAASEDDVIRYSSSKIGDGETHVCLVTGVKGATARLHSKIPLQGNKFTSLVSFKDGKGYDSYGHSQGINAPVSEEAEFAYSTALNHMLDRNSRNKFQIGSRTFVFWASNYDEAGRKTEESIFDLFGFSDSDEDDPDARIEQVRKVFKAIYSGELITSLDDRFYILGLAPNAARIAVIYWAEVPLKEFAGRINRHFEDMEICGANRPYMALRSILGAVTVGGKSSDVTPNLPDALVKSIFQGIPYPYTLFSSCIRRIRAEITAEKYNEAFKKGYITTRVAIIKAYLNRLNDSNKKIEKEMDITNNNQGYLCGRLFAVLDKIQEEANKQHTIRERYMNSASATPAAVFATILNLSLHHSEKLSEGRRIQFEQLKQEIMDKIDADGFPAHLDLQDQGRFFVGYYHQRQKLFTKNEKEENNNNQ